MLEALDRERFDVVPVGITRAGTWVPMPDEPERYRLDGDQTFEVPEGDERVVCAPGLPELLAIDVTGNPRSLGTIDVVFPLLHGSFGEDGTVQGLLEMAGMRYVGCGVGASAAGMDKHVTKALLTQAGIAAGRWQLVTDRAWRTDRQGVLARLADLGLPAFVKPARAGSSLGITKVDHPDDLADAIEEARHHDPRVIVEALLSGVEVECAVLGAGPAGQPRSSRPGLIQVSEDVAFYDYETKYVDHDAVALTIPAPLSPTLEETVREVAVRAFEELGCEGLARVDFFVDEVSGTVTVNEVNTMPGFTPYSMYPALWEHAGLSYSALVTELIEQALARPVGLR